MEKGQSFSANTKYHSETWDPLLFWDPFTPSTTAIHSAPQGISFCNGPTGENSSWSRFLEKRWLPQLCRTPQPQYPGCGTASPTGEIGACANPTTASYILVCAQRTCGCMDQPRAVSFPEQLPSWMVSQPGPRVADHEVNWNTAFVVKWITLGLRLCLKLPMGTSVGFPCVWDYLSLKGKMALTQWPKSYRWK